MVVHIINIQNEYLILIRENISDEDYFVYRKALEQYYNENKNNDLSIIELKTFTEKRFNNVEVYSSDDIDFIN